MSVFSILFSGMYMCVCVALDWILLINYFVVFVGKAILSLFASVLSQTPMLLLDA